MWRMQQSNGFPASFGEVEFAVMLRKFHEMKEGERKRFMRDPENFEILRSYDRYRERLRILLLLPLLVFFLFSVGTGLLLVR